MYAKTASTTTSETTPMVIQRLCARAQTLVSRTPVTNLSSSEAVR
jgi:hypothetical protein